MKDYYETAIQAMQTLEFYARTLKGNSIEYKTRVDEVTKTLRDEAKRLEEGYGGVDKKDIRAEVAFLKGFADALTSEARSQT